MAWLLAVSAAAHITTPLAIDAGRYLYRQYEHYAERAEKEGKRERLIVEARAQLRRGELKLGEFILKANAIDTEEEGKESKIAEARAKYNDYLGKLKELLAEGASVQEAIPQVLAEFNYHGIPGGRMSDALLEGGGSCEQTSHLVASLVYDAGHGEAMYLRKYVAHVAPIFMDGGKEYDLAAGTYSDGKGARLHASELVEGYALAHGLGAPEYEWSSAESSSGSARKEPHRPDAVDLPEGRPSGFTYPETQDGEVVAVPLFQRRAVKAFNPGGTGDGASARGGMLPADTNIADDPEYNGFSISCFGLDLLRTLNPVPDRSVFGQNVLIANYEERTPRMQILDDLVACIEKNKRLVKEGGSLAERVMRFAYLSALNQEAYWELEILGKHRLAEEAAKQRDRFSAAGEMLLAGIAAGSREADEFFAGVQEISEGNNFSLLHLLFLGQRGEDVIFGFINHRTEAETPNSRENQEEALAALLLNPATHERAMESVMRLGNIRQLDILNNALRLDYKGQLNEFIYQDGADAEAYRVCRAVQILSGEGQLMLEIYGRPEAVGPHSYKISDVIRKAVAEQGLNQGWQDAFIAYYSRETLRARRDPMGH